MTELERILSTFTDVTSFTELVVKHYPNVVIRPTTQLIDTNYISSSICMYNYFYYVNTCDIDMLFNDYNVIVNHRNNNIYNNTTDHDVGRIHFHGVLPCTQSIFWKEHSVMIIYTI